MKRHFVICAFNELESSAEAAAKPEEKRVENKKQKARGASRYGGILKERTRDRGGGLPSAPCSGIHPFQQTQQFTIPAAVGRGRNQDGEHPR